MPKLLPLILTLDSSDKASRDGTGLTIRLEAGMKQDIGAAANRLAGDPRISDYDFWRTLKNLDNEIYRIADNHQPIPIEMIRWRAIIRQARSRRGVAAS